MKKIISFLSAITLLALYGCSGDDIMDTYWRDNTTGEWLIGVTEDKVIYDCKIWDIASMDKSEGTYTIQAKHGLDSLDIRFGRKQYTRRTITIGSKQFDCSLIEGHFLPDYPKKDTCATFADNHYAEGDSVTIIGWIKPLPAILNWLINKIRKNQKNDKEVSVSMVTNILTGEDLTFTAPIDSNDHFMLRIPIENTTSFYLESGRGWARIVAEPNETYFLMMDPLQGKKLFMGKNARLLNEINAHKIIPQGYGIKEMETMGDIMNILDSVKIQTKEKMQELDSMCRMHPTLSERYRTYYRNKVLTNDARILMQGMYLTPNYELPEEYVNAVDENYWKELAEPYTLNSYEFSHFFNDYGFLLQNKTHTNDYKLKWIMDLAEKDGIIKLSAKDREAIEQHDLAWPVYNVIWKNAPDSLQKVLEKDFNKKDFMKVINEIQSRNPKYKDYSLQKFILRELEGILKEMNAREWSGTTQDILLCRNLCKEINWSRKSLGKEILAFADEHIHTPAARHTVHAMNNKYEQIGKRKLTDADNLKSNDVVKGMSDGEKILRKIIEPYKGKIILVDIWGTWCGPCKEGLSHSQEEYERLKDFDIVYLYLANRSSEDSWKNVIKEYNVMGDNVVHYNLPAEQQKAVENYIGVTGYPTYRLIDRDGMLLDVNASPQPLDALANLLERMK